VSYPSDPVPNWQDSPSAATPLDAANLNEDSAAIEQIQAFLPSLQLYIPFTAVQTASTVAAVANQFVLVSTASTAVTVNFPVAPANFAVVGIKMVAQASTNMVTAQLGGSDTFDVTGGSTTATLKLLNQGAIWQYNSSTAVWVKISDNLPLSQLDLRYVGSVAAGDSTITMGGTATAPTVKVAQANLTIAESQVTNLTSNLNSAFGAGGQWAPNVFSTQVENMERGVVGNSSLIMTGTTRTWLILLGLCPASTYASFKLFLSPAASGTAGTMTCALFSGSSLTSTSWSRLGSGNVTMGSLTTAGVITTSLAFTLASPAYVALEMVATTTWGTTQPSFAGSTALTLTGGSGFMNPASGCPVFGTASGTSAPGSTLNPTTGFTASAQKIWCALA
jgi:hypothetical protein